MLLHLSSESITLDWDRDFPLSPTMNTYLITCWTTFDSQNRCKLPWYEHHTFFVDHLRKILLVNQSASCISGIFQNVFFTSALLLNGTLNVFYWLIIRRVTSISLSEHIYRVMMQIIRNNVQTIPGANDLFYNNHTSERWLNWTFPKAYLHNWPVYELLYKGQ